jgi:amino acid permease
LKYREEFQILKMLLAVIFLYLLLFAKDFESIFPKDLQKKSGANVVQNVK